MAQRVRGLAAKPEAMSSNPKTQMVGESQLFSGLYMQGMAHARHIPHKQNKQM